MRHRQDLAEFHEERFIGKVDRTRRAQNIELETQEGEQARQGGYETGHAETVEQKRINPTDQPAGDDRHADRRPNRPTHIDPQHPQQRRRQTAHRADRKIDFAHHQYADDAERNDADGRGFKQEVDEVDAGDEQGVEAGEHRPDDGEADHDGDRPQVPRSHAIEKRLRRSANPDGVVDARVGAVHRGRGAGGGSFGVTHGVAPSAALRRWTRRDTELLAAPVIAPTSSALVASGAKTPLLRPSRSTTMRSATARTSSIL